MDFKISNSLPPALSKSDWVAIDTEWFGMEKHKMHRPITGTFACLTICALSDIQTVYVITDETQIKQALENVNDAVWVFHNAGFDITHLRRFADIPPRKKLWDVMIIERIMGGGLYDGDQFSLEDIVRRRLDLRMHKDIRNAFEKSTEMTPEMMEYAANDAYVTLLACENQKTQIGKSEYKVWTEIDRQALYPILDFKGFRLDVEAWSELANNNQSKADEIKANLPVNPASPKQVLEFLSKNGFKRLKDTQEKTLANMIAKYPESKAKEYADQVLEYRMYAKRASTYGRSFMEKHLEKEDGVDVIHANYWVVGAETGRTSSSNPNFQNIPVRETKDFRKCFIARPNNVLVIVDMGQQEARILAFESQDQKLIEIFNDDSQDVFVGMTKMIYKLEIDKSDPFRKQTKNTVYGVTYGMSAQGMAERYDMTEDEAQQAIDQFFSTFSGAYSWITQQQKKKDYVETIAGRKIWLNPYAEQVERNAVNSPIQGSAADQMKIALGNIYTKWKSIMGDLPFCCVGYIHDELIFDVPKDDAVKLADFVTKEMINAAENQCLGVKFTASAQICENWSEKE